MTRDLTEGDLKRGAVIRDPLNRTTLKLTGRSEASNARGGTNGQWRAARTSCSPDPGDDRRQAELEHDRREIRVGQRCGDARDIANWHRAVVQRGQPILDGWDATRLGQTDHGNGQAAQRDRSDWSCGVIVRLLGFVSTGEEDRSAAANSSAIWSRCRLTCSRSSRPILDVAQIASKSSSILAEAAGVRRRGRPS